MSSTSTLSARPPGSWLFLGLLACNGGSDDTGAGSGAPALRDANNFLYEGALSIASTEVESQQDVDIDWSALTTDIQGQPVDAATDIDQLELILFRYMSEDEVEEALSLDTLLQADIDLFLQHRNDEEDTTAVLSEFGLGGNKIDISTYFVEENGTWLLLLASGVVPGVGTRMLHFLKPATTDNHAVIVDDDSTTLSFDVSLHDLEPFSMSPGGLGAIDWSSLTIDGRGNPIDLDSIDEVWLAHYETTDLSDLENGFLGLEEAASEIFTMPTDGLTSGDLSNLADATGTASTGPTADGTWLLSLRCNTCFNPAPPFLTVLDVR